MIMDGNLISFFYTVLIPLFSYVFELLKFILCVLGIIALYKYIKHH